MSSKSHMQQWRFRLSEISAQSVFFISFVLLCLINRAHLEDPPYWDALVGVYTQGTWLYRHGMNYALLLQQPLYSAGGPRVNPLYALSALFALLNYVFSPPHVFLILHLLTLAAASLAITAYFMILRSRVSTGLAILWVAAAVSNPIWSGQTAALYLEIPMTGLLSLSAYYFWKRSFRAAAAWCLAAYFLKPAAFLQALAFAVVSLILLACRRRDKTLLRNAPAFHLLGVFAVTLMLNRLVGANAYLGGMDIHKLGRYMWLSILHIPHLYPTLALEGVAIAGLLAAAGSPGGLSLDENAPWLLFLVLLPAGFWLSFMITRFALVRYTVMIHLPMACLLAFLLAGHPRWSTATAGALLLLNLLNQQGRLLSPLPGFMGRSGERLERSREYLTDLASNRALCKLLEETMADEPIVVKWPFAQMLRIPELGYVRHPLPSVIEAGPPSQLAGAITWRDWASRAKNHQTLCIYSPTIFEMEGISLEPAREDAIVWADTSLPAPLILFRRTWR